MAPSPGVTIAGLLGSHPESIGLPIEVAAGAAGLERAITSPHIQKTGLALAGFHEYLRPGRVLVFGESEVRLVESLPVPGRIHPLTPALVRDAPCGLIAGGVTGR